MVGRVLFVLALLASLLGGSAQNPRQDQGKELIESRSAEPQGQSLYTNSHALIIGIDNYPNLPKNLQLRFGESDATAVRDMLVRAYGFSPDEVVTLTNEKATLANIRRELSQLASSKRVKPDDRILVYFSGHGQTVKLPTGGEMGFLIPSDAKIDLNDPSDPGPYLETCLPMKQVWDYLSTSPAKHACVIADACFSGMMASSRSIGMSQDTVNAMLARPARQVLTAGSVGQKTFERQELGHGVFTYKLLEEMRARSADKGKVFSLMDLYMSLQSSVSNMTGGKQIPQFGNVDTEGQVLFCAGNLLTATTQPENPTQPPDNPKPPVQATTAKLTLTSNPSNAAILVDGARRGTTPYTLQVQIKNGQPVTVQIRLEAKGYIPAETAVTLKPGDDISLPTDLKPIPPKPPAITTAQIVVDSNPPGASISLDGSPAGTAPVTLDVDLKNKKEQKFRLGAALDGFVPAETTVTVQPGKVVNVPFSLKAIPIKTPPPRKVKQLALSQSAVLQGNVPVTAVAFSPDARRVAVSGLDYSLWMFDAKGGAGKRVEAPKNAIVRITPDWKSLLIVRLLTDGENTWASVTRRDLASNRDLDPIRVPLRPGSALSDVYAGNGRLILCGSYGSGDNSNGLCSVVDFAAGQATTFTGGYRITSPASSADGSTYAVYMEPLDLRSPGRIAVISSDLTQLPKLVSTEGINSSAGIDLSADGKLLALSCQRTTATGTQIVGTRIYDLGTGEQVKELPLIKAAALIANGSRLLGWRPQIGGTIVELLDSRTGDGLGETPGGELWLSRDEKLVAQASPEGLITIYRLTQP